MSGGAEMNPFPTMCTSSNKIVVTLLEFPSPASEKVDLPSDDTRLRLAEIEPKLADQQMQNTHMLAALNNILRLLTNMTQNQSNTLLTAAPPRLKRGRGVERWRGSGGWVKEVGDSANRLMPFRVEFELTSIFGQVYPPSSRHQLTYPCHRDRFFWGTKFCTPTRTPEKPVTKPVGFYNSCSSLIKGEPKNGLIEYTTGK